jgi:hypothetical protein
VYEIPVAVSVAGSALKKANRGFSFNRTQLESPSHVDPYSSNPPEEGSVIPNDSCVFDSHSYGVLDGRLFGVP